MLGDTSKAGRWPECDVWNAPIGTTPPLAGEDPAAEWDLVGFLDGDAGVVKALDEDSSTLKAWGGVPIENINQFNGESFKFTAVEDNDVVWGIVYAGSPAPEAPVAGVTTRIAKVPNRVPSAWLIRLKRASGDVKEYLIAKGTGAPSSDVTENEGDLGGTEITVSVLSDSENTLHTERLIAAGGGA